MKAFQAALAALINIKPIIILKDGMLDMREKVRTRQRAVDRVLEIVHQQVDDHLVNVAVVHSQSLEAARQLMQKVNKTLHVNEAIISESFDRRRSKPGTRDNRYCRIPGNVSSKRKNVQF